MLETLSLEHDKSRKNIAIYADAFNDRDPFFITWLYRESLLLYDRNKDLDSISNTLHEAFLIHAILVIDWDTIGSTDVFIELEPILQYDMICGVSPGLIKGSRPCCLEIRMSG
jgi:hypothetical protein